MMDLQSADIKLASNTPNKHHEYNLDSRKGRLHLSEHSTSVLPSRNKLDLKMYLRGGRQNEFHSEAKRRQERRLHAQSLHFDRR